MASFQFQNVKDEKADAMRKFRRKRNLANILRFFNVSAALLLFSCSSCFPIAVQTFWCFYAELMPLLNNPLYAFLLGNAIILSVYSLSGRNGGSGNFYDEFLTNSESRLKITAPTAANNPEEFTPEKQTLAVDPSERHSPEKQIGTVESSDKRIICSAVAESPVFYETVTAVTETTMTTTTECCTTVSRTMTTSGEKVSEKKCYRRVQSESFERRVVVAPRRELKRLNTDLSGERRRRLCCVEGLSNEEFNRTVEDFIAKHKRMQREEQRESQKTEYLALTQ